MAKSTRWKYYQPNKKDLKDKCGDCAVRALTKFLGVTWLEAFDGLVRHARQTQQMVNALPNIKLYMEELQVPYTSVYNPKAKHKETVNDFVKTHKSGEYVLYIRVGYNTHLVAVSDGYFYDTWDCGDRIVYGYWEKA